jgi:hypothetical protein
MGSPPAPRFEKRTPQPVLVAAILKDLGTFLSPPITSSV